MASGSGKATLLMKCSVSRRLLTERALARRQCVGDDPRRHMKRTYTIHGFLTRWK